MLSGRHRAHIMVRIKRRSAFVVHLKEKHGLTKDDVNIDECAPKIEPKKSREEREKAKRAFKNEAPDVSVERTARGHHVHHAPIVLPRAPPMFGDFTDRPSTPSQAPPSVKTELPEFSVLGSMLS